MIHLAFTRTMNVGLISAYTLTDANSFKMSSEIGVLSGISSLEAILTLTTRTFPKQSLRGIMMTVTPFTQC